MLLLVYLLPATSTHLCCCSWWCSICSSVQGLQYEDVNISQPLTEAIWEATAKRYDILVVNFFAPWCPWCVAAGFCCAHSLVCRLCSVWAPPWRAACVPPERAPGAC